MTPAENERLKALLVATAKRDEPAFSRLYDATAAKLFGVALRILRREDWAEEVIQDCYVSIWNNAGSYSAALSAPMTWMTSIVRNRCLDWLRRPVLDTVTAGASNEDEDLLDQIPAGEPGPLAQLAAAGDARAIAHCLTQLEAKQRQAIMLAFYQGLTHSELAAHMREPLGTVKTWIRRGLERLKGCLGAA